MKEVKIVELPQGEPEGVYVHNLVGPTTSKPSLVDDQLTVDEHPHVVVTHEIESLAAGIGKLGVGLGIEVVVVRAAFMPEALAAAPVPSSGK